MTERQIQRKDVIIGTSLNPDSLAITKGDIVVWLNNTPQVQTASSIDAGQTFTTGPIQPGAKSLPIAVPASTAYRVTPATLSGTITVNNERNDRRVNMAISYAKDIRPLFTADDVDHMTFKFHLDQYESVKKYAKQINDAIQNNRMPQDDDGNPKPWPDDWKKKFQQWIDDGVQP
jgi:hypothetical protein